MMGTTKESELHILGKSVFEDAEGKDIQLPAGPPSPRFNPPLRHTVKKVEWEKELPYAGHNGRRADVVLTSVQGIKVIVEVKYSNGKGMNYGFDVNDAGHWLVVQLDVARWKEDKCLMPDFSSPNMLQDVLNQVVWLSPGKPCSMEWRPYKDIWHRYEHDVPPDRDAASREAAARWLPIQLSTVTVHLGWYEEHGWELHQNGGALREYRIRQPDGGGFQAFHNHFDRGSLGPPVYSRHHKNRILEGMEQEDIWAGPVRTSWKDAVKDLFGYRAPGVEPLF